MLKYQVTVKPGVKADGDCACDMTERMYTVEAESKMSAITVAGNRWYKAECPDKQPAECAHDRDEIIAECSYIVKEI
ncbi:MAG: hypothetical protein D3924_17800 [Candidatus Electrothrix sp. AR4]|nr:hypothetical protein [Candidatus Electrothrix sp. AR4]